MKRDLRTWNLSMTAHIDGKMLRFDQLLTSKPLQRKTEGPFSLSVRTGETIKLKLRRRDGKRMKVDYVEYRFSAPLLNFSQVILPDTGRTYMEKDKAIFLRSAVTGTTAPNIGHPFLALIDQAGNVSFSFGLLTSLEETAFIPIEPAISARNALIGGTDTFTIAARVPSEGWAMGGAREVSEEIFMAKGFRSWFHAHQAYADLLKKSTKALYPVNDAALEPTWCTWTAWGSDELSDESVLANARVCKKLGITSLILDDGWFGPGLDTDDRPLNIGDYYPDPAKFRDLPRLVEKIHAMGLKVLLWYAPTCISPDSKAYRRWRGYRMTHKGKPVAAPNGFYSLCPCNPEVRDYFCAEIARMLNDYGVDGFKVDLYNTLPVTPCDADHAHDTNSVVDGVYRLMKQIWDTCLGTNPNTLMELKQNYGNVIAAQYGTMVRTGDAAYDTDVTLRRCFYQQAYAPVVHNDYLAWSIHDTPQHLAVMMIKQITGGVPTFSSHLPKMSRPHLAVLKAWLSFYHEHKSVWRNPRAPQNKRMDVWQMADGRNAVVSAVFDACSARLPRKERVVVLNGTWRDRILLSAVRDTYNVSAYDCRHRVLTAKRMRIDKDTPVNVPPGGMLIVTRKAK